MKKLLLFLAITLSGCHHHKVEVIGASTAPLITLSYEPYCWYEYYQSHVPDGFVVKGWRCVLGTWVEYKETIPL